MAISPAERRGHTTLNRGLNGHRSNEFIGPNIIPLIVTLEDEITARVEVVGGKAASLAELNKIPGIKVPEAFVVTTSLADEILKQNPEIKLGIDNLDAISEKWLRASLRSNNLVAEILGKQIAAAGDALVRKMGDAKIPDSAQRKIETEYDKLCERVGGNIAVAVRSSGISEDGKDNSFAGQYDSYLHQQGKEAVLESVKKCLASQFTKRAIVYRNEGRLTMSQEELERNPQDIKGAIDKSKKLSHGESRLAVVVQRMVNASASGVGFSVDSTSSAPFTHLDINYGLGESVVGGRANPDSYYVDPRTGKIVSRNLGQKEKKIIYGKKGTREVDVPEEDRKKFVISDSEAEEIAKSISAIKEKYGREMDTEFAIDGKKRLYFVQARPETIASKEESGIVKMRSKIIPEDITKKAEIIFKGGTRGSLGAASGIAVFASSIEEAEKAITEYGRKGEKIILITKRTDPDWVPIMKKVSGIITEIGGATCHAAIVSRELGVPCIIGAGEQIKYLRKATGTAITIDANDYNGKTGVVYKGNMSLEEVGEDIKVQELLDNPITTIIGLNIANIDQARKMHALGELGDRFKISLLRTEFLLEDIGVHVSALVDYDDPGRRNKLNSKLRKKIADKIAGYGSGKEYFQTKLTEGIAGFAALFPNSPITLRTTDFKTNEYKSLIGGEKYEPPEPNPMMGNRGVGRYIRPENREAFKWELEAIKKARDMGYKNIQVMFPMVRDLGDLEDAYANMKEVDMGRGVDGLKVGMMVELPANVVLLEKYGKLVDFFSIGSNDLTQFLLGVDRDNEKLTDSPRYGASNPAVVEVIQDAIRRARKMGIDIGICGQEPSNNPEFAEMLVTEGIDSIGVTPDTFLKTHRLVRKAEQNKKREAIAPTSPTTIFP